MNPGMRVRSGSSPLGRYRARVPLPYVQTFRERYGSDGQRAMLADVERRVRKDGPVLLAMQDPSDPTTVTVLARGGARSDDVVEVMSGEPVEEPSSWGLAFGPVDVPLEPGMLDEEARAVSVALRIERNPRHLEGFAHTCDPYLPTAATLLRRRAAILEPGVDARTDSRSANVDDARTALGNMAPTGLPTDLTNLEIKRTACALANGEDAAGIPVSMIMVAQTTLTRTHTRLAEGGTGAREPVYVIDHAAMLAVCPPTGNEVFVSPTAAQLALAQTKPRISGVARFERARSLFDELRRGDVPPEDRMQLLLARAMLEKARSCIERRRWVEWYRKQA